MTEEKNKSKWCLIVDIPAILFMLPFMLIGTLYALAEIGYIFSYHHINKWFMRSYEK